MLLSMWGDPFKKIKYHIIDESQCQKLCHTNKFNNPKELLGKAQTSSPYFVHYGLLVYLEQLYPEQNSKQDSKTRKKLKNKIIPVKPR